MTSGERRHVVMLDNGAVFIPHWVDAAGLVAEVTTLRPMQRSDIEARRSLREVDAHRGLFLDDEDGSYAYEVPYIAPARLLGRHAGALDVRAMERALRAIARSRRKIDLIHAHFYPAASSLPSVRRRTGIPYVVTEHSTALTRESPDKVVSRPGLAIARRVYAAAACVMPVSHSLLAAIEELGLRGTFEVLDNPVDISRFGLAETSSGGTLELVCAGRLEPVKAMDSLLESLRNVRARGLDARLTVYGGGPEHAALERLVTTLDLQGVATLAGPTPRQAVVDGMTRAHMFVLASIIENQPFAVIEALCTGLPVAATAVGGMPETVGSADGVLVPRRDPVALADAIMQIAESGSRFDPPAIARRARERFSTQAVARRLNGVYQRACRSDAGVETARDRR